MRAITWTRVGLVALLAFVLGAPCWYYRYQYNQGKRLREVEPGRVYRSGQLTGRGFREAIRTFGFKTVINVQNEEPNPKLKGDRTEEEVCRELGVKYVFIAPDLLERNRVPQERPKAIEEFLQVMDDPTHYPVLIHCRAGLHRTGVLVAVYRMEYQGWSWHGALEELIDNGFGMTQATARNDYIMQYLMTYKPRSRTPPAVLDFPAERIAARP